MTFIAVPASLRTSGEINEYSDAAARRKAAMHKDGKTFLKKLATALGLSSSEFTLSSNKAGIAVAGEVTLHADTLYVQMCDSSYNSSLRLLYRSCKTRKDYSGGTNNYVTLEDMNDEHRQERTIQYMRKLMELNAVPA